jgi:hypothetical protein
MSFGEPLYGPDFGERFELLGGMCRPTTCTGESWMEDGTGMCVEEMNEIETRDYGGGAEEDFSGIVFCSGFFDAEDMADIVACFPFQRQ